jgi:hypothetical protein
VDAVPIMAPDRREALVNLTHLASEDPAIAAVVNLRYFASPTIDQAADAMNILVRTANRLWT